MLVPDSAACENQISSTTPIPAAQTQAAQAQAAALQAVVNNAQQSSNALLVANPWESWQGGLNLMRDIQRGNTQVSNPAQSGVPAGPPQLPGFPPAGEGGSLWDRWKRNLGMGPRGRGRNGRSGNARQQTRGWNSRFVTGPGGKFQDVSGGSAVVDCIAEPADVVPSDAPELPIPSPPPNPSLRTEQPVNIIVTPPAQYAPCSPPPRTGNLCADLKSGAVLASTVPAPTLYACSQAGYVGVGPTLCPAGMGEWSASVAQPGAVPAECSTGPSAQRAGAAGVPWWMWALAGLAVVAVASTETKTRRSGARQKRAA